MKEEILALEKGISFSQRFTNLRRHGRWGYKKLSLWDRFRLLFKPWIVGIDGENAVMGKKLDGYIIILKEKTRTRGTHHLYQNS